MQLAALCCIVNRNSALYDAHSWNLRDLCRPYSVYFQLSSTSDKFVLIKIHSGFFFLVLFPIYVPILKHFVKQYTDFIIYFSTGSIVP